MGQWLVDDHSLLLSGRYIHFKHSFSVHNYVNNYTLPPKNITAGKNSICLCVSLSVSLFLFLCLRVCSPLSLSVSLCLCLSLPLLPHPANVIFMMWKSLFWDWCNLWKLKAEKFCAFIQGKYVSTRNIREQCWGLAQSQSPYARSFPLLLLNSPVMPSDQFSNVPCVFALTIKPGRPFHTFVILCRKKKKMLPDICSEFVSLLVPFYAPLS